MKTSGFIFLFAALLLLSACHKNNPQNQPPAKPKVVAYLMGTRDWTVSEIEAKKITHINYAFANVREDRIVSENPDDSLNFVQLNTLKKQNPDLKILISVGGWSWSDNFSDAALTQASRETFAQSAADFVEKYQIDGVDIDWEYPGLPGEGNVHRPEDKENFTLMLAAVRQKLDQLAQEQNRAEPYLLTIASAASPDFLEHTEMDKAHKYLDFINIMTYDYYGAWDPQTGHHTNLYAPENDSYKDRSADKALQEHIEAGIPVEKLVLGVAFYGRGWRGVTPENNGLFQPGEQGFALNYSAILDTLEKPDYQRFWDSQAKAPYLWSGTDSVFITYDDEESMRHKCDFVKQKGMGGVMFWEYTGDPSGALLNTLSENILAE